MSRPHAVLSASSSHRWLRCTPSARFEMKFPDKGSPYAEEGTRAHALAEEALRCFLGDDARAVLCECGDAEMQEAVGRYVDVCVEKITAARSASPDALIRVEERLDFSEFVPQGFGTGDMVIISDCGLEVVDLKYGKGVPVSAEGNSQMRLYALGALAAYGWLYDLHRIRMTIVQPRLDSVSSDEMSEGELLAWGAKVKTIATEAYAGRGEFHAGEHCRFCKARTACRAYAEEMRRHIRGDFLPGAELEPDEIADIVRHAKDVKSWLESVEAYALGRALTGDTFPGLKLVAGRSVRKIKDETAAAASLAGAGYADIYKPQSLKTITELEKLCGKKKFAELVECAKPAGKPTLVPESDKRPALEVGDIRKDFEAVGDD